MWKFIASKPKLAKSGYTFQAQYSFDKRKKEADRLLKEYPGFIPVIFEKNDDVTITQLKKNKYILNKNTSIGQLLYIIRNGLDLSASQALFIFTGSEIPSIAHTLETVYEKHKDADGFLYITYATENTFG